MKKTTSRNRFLSAIARENQARPPVWIMRQAGRYLPEYRALKEKYSFLKMVQTPDLATEVTLQPLKRFPLDAAIVFSDILIIPEALGQGYTFRSTGGIGMDYAISTATDISKLNAPEAVREKLAYLPTALRQIKGEIGNEKALLGFGGSPWTLATYMVEGGSSKEFNKIRGMLLAEPKLLEALLDHLAEALIELFKMQIEAGADAIQIFDSWGSACPGSAYERYSLRPIKKIIEALPKDFPIILFPKGMASHRSSLLNTGAKILAADQSVNLPEWSSPLDSKVAVQGNLDPLLMTMDPAIVYKATRAMLKSMSTFKGYIFNLGHGITPNARIESVESLFKAIEDHEQEIIVDA